MPRCVVPPMSADARQNGNDVRGAIDALAERVDTLASIVRETAGSLAASRGEVASLDRRVQERIGADTQRSAEALASVRGEIDALREYVADAGTYSGNVAVAASNPLQETVATLTERVETLAEIIRSTAGRLAAEQSRISALTEELARGDQRVEARFAELRRDLRVMSEQAARVPAPPPPAPADPGLERRVEERVGSLVERVDFLSGTVSTTAGKLAARDGELARAEQERRQELARSNEVVRAVRDDLAALKERLAVDPLLQKRLDGLANTVEALGDRVTTLSGIVGETAGRRTGRETEIAALDERLGEVGTRIDDVAHELRREIAALATAVDGAPSGPGSAALEVQVEAFGEQLARLEVVVEDASGAAEQVGVELREELAVLAAAVERERIDLHQAATEWEARRAALEERMDELAVFATSTAERSADEVGRALHTLAERLEALERDRLEVATDATYAESAWAGERAALEARLDAIAGSISEERSHSPEVEQLVDDLAARLARMEDERETVADLAALAETWTAELAALETRVGEGLSTLEERSGAGAADFDAGLSESVDELTERIAQIERDRDAVRGELARTAASWAAERVTLQEHVAELAALATSTAERGADEMGQALHTLAERLERLEQDRQAVASHATHAESAWALERQALEARLDSIAAAITEERPQAPEVALLIDELAGRLARMEDERETVADLAALAETWTAELAALEARVDEGLSSLEEQVTAEALGAPGGRHSLAVREPRRVDAADRADRARP